MRGVDEREREGWMRGKGGANERETEGWMRGGKGMMVINHLVTRIRDCQTPTSPCSVYSLSCCLWIVSMACVRMRGILSFRVT